MSISRHDINPKKGITGNFFMLRGTLKGLFRFGLLYRSHINERLTSANVIKTPRLVMFAINSMSPKKMKSIEKIMVVNIAVQGVFVFL